jgi:tetratricopeptide (TPR) repeat protein
MKAKAVVIVSSTVRDLPEYRAQVMDACLRADMFPKMMEHLPAMNADAVQASLNHLVDEADVYVGIFAHRYGYIPEGHNISITQMEYERAVERGIPRLICLMHDDVPVLPKDFERGDSAEKLERLKDRFTRERVVAFFKSPEDLRGLVVQALGEIKEDLDAKHDDSAARRTRTALVESLHHTSEIPLPPEPYTAHPYTLLQVRGLIGRKEEMETLTDWVTGNAQFAAIRIFNIVAIGGMGKSALAWAWFNRVAPQEMTPLAGRIWWSFYESDATFENFVTRTLAYVSRRTLDDVKQRPLSDREDLLLRILDQEPFLIVLDGLERILTAYARLDAAYLRDSDALDDETANRVAGALGLPESAGKSFFGKHRLRTTADPRAGRFLRKLARVRASRILISTRLYPADLQAPSGAPSPGCFARFLQGLNDRDALELWRAFGARGSRDEMLPLFRRFDKHPLLIQLLACEVAEFRDSPGDFDAWVAANPDFNPFGVEMVNVQSHVLAHALHGLSLAEQQTLYVISGFRMPTSMSSLKALLLRSDDLDDPERKPFRSLEQLDRTLTVLEDRGLLGWDRLANRYDLHPIVRGVVWTGLDPETRTALYATLRTHFEVMPMVTDYLEVETLDDLTPAIELYNSLIGLNEHNGAFLVFQERLQTATLYRLSASHLRIALLEALFPSGLEAPPALSHRHQTNVLNSLALGYLTSGQPGAAVSLFRSAIEIATQDANWRYQSTILRNLANALILAGQLRAAEISALESFIIHARDDRYSDGLALRWIGLARVARGKFEAGNVSLHRSLRVLHFRHPQSEGVANAYLAEAALWMNDAAYARQLADRAWELAGFRRYERDYIRAARLQGVAALRLGDFETASERLHHALIRARAVTSVEDEVPTLCALAEWHRQNGRASRARGMLDDVWEAAERGPYPLLHADALDVIAHVERDTGNTDAAVEAATKAYRLSWCDGPPFAYHWGLEKARAHLAALGAPEPDMPSFDESQHEAMPEVELNPPDEFAGDEVSGA